MYLGHYRRNLGVFSMIGLRRIGQRRGKLAGRAAILLQQLFYKDRVRVRDLDLMNLGSALLETFSSPPVLERDVEAFQPLAGSRLPRSLFLYAFQFSQWL